MNKLHLILATLLILVPRAHLAQGEAMAEVEKVSLRNLKGGNQSSIGFAGGGRALGLGVPKASVMPSGRSWLRAGEHGNAWLELPGSDRTALHSGVGIGLEVGRFPLLGQTIRTYLMVYPMVGASVFDPVPVRYLGLGLEPYADPLLGLAAGLNWEIGGGVSVRLEILQVVDPSVQLMAGWRF